MMRARSPLHIRASLVFAAAAFVASSASAVGPSALASRTAAKSSAPTPRTTVALNLGWRFHYGAPTGTCDVTFGTNYTGLECAGLSAAPAATNASACEAACCDTAGCQIWQFSAAPLPSGGCWIGAIPAAGCNRGSSWLSFANASRPTDAVPQWALRNFSDAAWAVVDTPHDFLITGPNASASPYVPTGNAGQAFISKTVAGYRKHFALPASWAGTHIELYVEGMLEAATYYLNDMPLGYHALGYTSAFFRIDNATGGLRYGAGAGDNVLAVYADATDAVSTEWWYAGGGAGRSIFLHSTSPAAYVVPHGLHASVATAAGTYTYPSDPTAGVTLSSAGVTAFAAVATDGAAATSVIATFTIYAADGVTVAATGASAALPLAPGGGAASASAALTLSNAQCWSVGRPYSYTLSVVITAAAGGAPLDAVNTTLGVRGVRFDAGLGAFVNEQRVRFRAFCDHESFAAVGMAVPARVNLFRYQAMRGMGGNGRRFSHNPPSPVLLELADRLGIMTLDENRIFALGLAPNMADLVDRDRNHPSVIFWSFCNEPGCNNNDKTAPVEPTQDFKAAVEAHDGTRAVTGNMCVGWGSCPNEDQYMTPPGLPMSQQLDVQGFSHVNTAVFEAYHAAWPNKPLVASECCSCETQRGEDNDIPYNTSLVFYSSFNADCLAEQTNYALALPYVAGSFSWTSTDYLGEPDHWPHVSSSFGSIDLSGFPKSGAWWYRSWWLANISTTAADRPPIPDTHTFVYIAEGWRANPANVSANREINVYSNAPFVRVATSAGAQSGLSAMPGFGYVRVSLPFAPGSITATAYATDGATVLGTFTKKSWGAPAALILSVDSPSPTSGTGSALFLDGLDAALVRVTIVDAAGNICEDASTRVTFAVTSGPGRILGTGNGDPANQEPMHAPSRVAYHGLLRAVIGVTQASAVATSAGDGGAEAVALLASVNVEAGIGPQSSRIVAVPAGTPTPPITISASADGLTGAAISIATSIAFADSVFEVASANVQSAYTGM